MRNILFKAALLAALVGLASCSTKTYQKINYLQDVRKDTTFAMKDNAGIIIQPKDWISIVVAGVNPELAYQFNLPNVSYQAGAETASASQYRLMGYSVGNDGTIDFPVLGKLHVAGLTRWQVSELVKEKLTEGGYLRNPVVTVEFMNFKIVVTGEVTRPGSYSITGDKITILEAISLAGDLTIYGKRENVSVIREKGDKKEIYVLDLRSSDIFKSEAYYLKQNDVVYVEPNTVRAGQSTINENSIRSAGFWVSITSLAITTANLLVTLTR